MKPSYLLMMSFILLFKASSAFGQSSEGEFSDCSQLEDLTEQLTCLGESAKSLIEEAQAGQGNVENAPADDSNSGGIGRWYVSYQRDPSDDSEVVFAILNAVEGQSSDGTPITFVARCRGSELEAFIIWSEELGNDSVLEDESLKFINVAIGEAEPIGDLWNLTNNNQMTYMPFFPGQFLQDIKDAGSFTAETIPEYSESIVAKFDTQGAHYAFQPLADACGWDVK